MSMRIGIQTYFENIENLDHKVFYCDGGYLLIVKFIGGCIIRQQCRALKELEIGYPVSVLNKCSFVNDETKDDIEP